MEHVPEAKEGLRSGLPGQPRGGAPGAPAPQVGTMGTVSPQGGEGTGVGIRAGRGALKETERGLTIA
jgi:hypothetical protein